MYMYMSAVMTLLMSGLLCESLGVVDRAVQSGPRQAGPTRQMKLVYQCQGDHNWHWMTAETQVNWHTPIMIIIIGTWGREGRRVRERERERALLTSNISDKTVHGHLSENITHLPSHCSHLNTIARKRQQALKRVLKG